MADNPTASQAADDLTGQIAQARKAGYPDDDIVKFLGIKRPDLTPKISTAWQQGYSPTEIVNYLSKITAPPPEQPDVIERGLNYHPENPVAQAALGVPQGMAKGAMSSAIGIHDVINRATGQPDTLTPQQRQNLTVPSGYGQGTGKFIEQAGEYAVPSGIAGEALKGAPLLARLAAQSSIGTLVSGAQSGGDPVQMAIGGALGGGGEAASATISGIRKLANAPLVANARNYRDAFAAVPTQMRDVVTDAMPVMQKYGIAPQKSVPEMKAALDDQLTQFAQQYAARRAAGVYDKTMPAQQVIDMFDNMKNNLKTSQGKIPSTAQHTADLIDAQIQDVKDAADTQGNITFADLEKLRDGANKKVNWNDPGSDVYRAFGNVHRQGMDIIEPGTAELNHDYQKIFEASKMAQNNIDMGRGVLPSRFEQGIRKATQPVIGAQAVGDLFGLTGMPGASFLGRIVGAAAYPKLAQPVVQALQNAADQGLLTRMPGAQRTALAMMMRLGDTAGIMRLLGQGAISSVAARTAPTAP